MPRFLILRQIVPVSRDSMTNAAMYVADIWGADVGPEPESRLSTRADTSDWQRASYDYEVFHDRAE